MTPDEVRDLLKVIVTWAEARSDITGLAGVGSWARGTARAGSDLDLMLLVDCPSEYRQVSSWIARDLAISKNTVAAIVKRRQTIGQDRDRP